MSNKIDPTRLTGWTLNSVNRCRECRPTKDGYVIVCGWHENLTAAAQLINDLRDILDRDR